MTLLLIIVFVLSIIQSFFGVGLLVFGTPILLLCGYPFPNVLAILLPCSIAISLIQVVQGWRETRTMRLNFVIFVVPAVALGSYIVIWRGVSVDVGVYVGAMLLITGLFRLSRGVRDRLRLFFQEWKKPSLVLIGFVHGMTNMGGGLLTLLSNALFIEKEKIRANIALGYLFMAVAQIGVLLLLTKSIFLEGNRYYTLPLISGGVHLLIGNRVFNVSSQLLYQHLMTAFVFLFGFALVFF